MKYHHACPLEKDHRDMCLEFIGLYFTFTLISLTIVQSTDKLQGLIKEASNSCFYKVITEFSEQLMAPASEGQTICAMLRAESLSIFCITEIKHMIKVDICSYCYFISIHQNSPRLHIF